MTVKQTHPSGLKIDERQRHLAIVFEMDDITRNYPVVEKTFIGSSSVCGIRTSARDIEPVHAQIVPTDDGFIIHDLYSGKGIYLNGQRIEHQAVVGDRDIIRIGPKKFKILVIMQDGKLASGQIR